MTDQQPETKKDIGNIQRFVAFLGVLLILSSQFYVFSQPVDFKAVFPGNIWLGVLGVIIFILSRVIPPTPFLQKLSTRLLFQEQVFWIFAAVILSILAAGSMALFMIYTRTNYIPVVTTRLLGAGGYHTLLKREV
jgi:hypothetical protein